MQKRERQAVVTRLAFAGAVEEVLQLAEIFPDLLVEATRIAKERSPRRNMPGELRERLAAATSNGSTPKRKYKYSTARRRAIAKRMTGRKWTPQQRARFLASMKKRREAAK